MKSNEQEFPESADLYLIHDGSLDIPSLSELSPDYRVIGLAWIQHSTPPDRSRILVYLNDEQLRTLAAVAIEKQWEVGLLPHPKAEQASRAIGVSGGVEDAFTHFLQVQAIEADVLTCNDQVVFSSVVIGKVLDLRLYDARRRSAFFSAIRAVRALRLRRYTLTTGKEQKIHLAVLGMVVLQHTQSTLIGRCFSEVLSIADGRLTLLAFAPRSILVYLRFLVRLLLPRRISLSRLPRAVGLIRSSRVLLEAPAGIDYSLDGTPQGAKTVEFRILDQRLLLLPGPALAPKEEHCQTKDTIKMNNLPVGETA
jgi:diacylglycerol kinase family enzyme